MTQTLTYEKNCQTGKIYDWQARTSLYTMSIWSNITLIIF